MTSRDYLAESKDRLGEADALLSAWMDELRTCGGHGSTHDRLVLARQSLKDALEWLDEVEEAIRADESAEMRSLQGCC